MYKFLIVMITSFAIYYRPFYSVLLLVLFYFEYYNAALMIYTVKTTEKYCKINIPQPDFSDTNLIDVWFSLCRINAFMRVYYIFLKKKKINIFSLILFFIFYIFYIPFRLLKLAYYFITSKEDFRTSLIFLTLDSYNCVKDLQIEVLNKKVYLNCNNLTKLSKLILNSNKLLDQKTFCKGMENLKKASVDFSKKESAYGRCEVKLSKIYDETGRPYSNVPHYTVVENGTALHATSNVCRVFKANQRVDGIIPSLVKEGAVRPGTIITKGVSQIKTISNNSVWVPNSELNVVKARYVEFAVDNNIRNYQIEKEEAFINILQENFKLDKNINKDLIRGLRYNEFTRDLNIVDNKRFEDEYNVVYKEITKDRGDL